jgi:hypothetical protein
VKGIGAHPAAPAAGPGFPGLRYRSAPAPCAVAAPHPSNPLRGAAGGGILEKRRPLVKKFLVLVVLAASISPAIFSLSESWTGLGFGWGNFFEDVSKGGDTAKTYMSSPGVTLNSYGFWNRGNIGFLSNMAFLFPNRSTLDINGTKTSVDLSVYDILFQFNVVIGPGFRFNVNDRLALQFGVGLNYMQTFGSYTMFVASYGYSVGYTLLAFNLGVGGDVGVKFDITDTLFISTGSTFSFDFANLTSVYSSFGNTSGWASNYSMFGVRPYLCIGFNSWAEEPGLFKGKMGKPK